MIDVKVFILFKLDAKYESKSDIQKNIKNKFRRPNTVRPSLTSGNSSIYGGVTDVVREKHFKLSVILLFYNFFFKMLFLPSTPAQVPFFGNFFGK
jgi:hypothetical protein